MMRKALVVLAMLVGCGDPDEGAAVDAGAQPGLGTGDSAVAALDAAARSDGGGTTGGGTTGGGTTGGGTTGGGTTGGGTDAGGVKPDGGGSTGGTEAGVSADAGSVEGLEKFSFFVTSLASMRELSKSQSGFGGDLRFGETGDGAGLRGADKICTTIAEKSMPGSGAKEWRAFLSTSTVNAKDRIGQGPWYDRKGRVLAMTLTALLKERPEGANSQIINDFPNELGVPNHDPDGTGKVDNHDTLTGSNAMGMLYTGGAAASVTCNDWTSAEPSGKPRVGHTWPRSTGGSMGGGFGGGGMPGGIGGGDGSMNNWMSALDEAGCAPGVSLVEMGPPMANNPTVGSGGGYGAIYCFALSP